MTISSVGWTYQNSASLEQPARFHENLDRRHTSFTSIIHFPTNPSWTRRLEKKRIIRSLESRRKRDHYQPFAQGKFRLTHVIDDLELEAYDPEIDLPIRFGARNFAFKQITT